MGKKQASGDKLRMWQERLAQSDAAYKNRLEAEMDERERLYGRERTLRPLVPGDHQKNGAPKQATHVRNIVFELVESQVSSSIPAPKVTPRRKEDEGLADVIEHFLRNELDRLPFETINDLAERTVPIQGGAFFLVDWDNTKQTRHTVGEIQVTLLHPKQIAPQPGVYTGIQDMDWVIVKLPTTKDAILRRYGVDVYREGEEEPELRGERAEPEEHAITQYMGFARNAQGGIDRYCWVNDVELEDLVNYQARRQPVCAACGRMRPLKGQITSVRQEGETIAGQREMEERMLAGRMLAGRMLAQQLAQEFAGGAGGWDGTMERPGLGSGGEKAYDGGPCPWCGGNDWITQEQEMEEIQLPIDTDAGTHIDGATAGLDETGRAVMRPTRVPFYRPGMFPIVLQRSVSVYGQLLGNSDVEVIRDQQNTINRMEQKIIDRLVKAGTRVSLPDRANLRMDPEDSERWYLGNPADKALIGVYNFSGNLEYEMAYMANVYEEARQMLGITDSFQGRRDTTATSGKAKEFSAAQSAGRLESKRIMKNAAYAQLFELMFKFALAYSDEPRMVSYKNSRGETEYQQFNRYDFLEQDADGQWHWNDQFLFSCDTSAPLASNREAMWQETRMNLQTGAFGDPASTETLVLFWSKMEQLHYPGAGDTKSFLEERLERERAQAMQKMQAQQFPQMGQRAMGTAGEEGIPPEMAQAVIQQARQDAEIAAGRGGGLEGEDVPAILNHQLMGNTP